MRKINLLAAFALTLIVLFTSCGEEKKETLFNKEKIGNVKKKLKKTAEEVNEEIKRRCRRTKR